MERNHWNTEKSFTLGNSNLSQCKPSGWCEHSLRGSFGVAANLARQSGRIPVTGQFGIAAGLENVLSSS